MSQGKVKPVLLDVFKGKEIVEVVQPPGTELIEDVCSLDFIPGDLHEGEGGKRPYLKGRLGWVDRATANGRMYPRKLMVREIARLSNEMKSRQVYGELDHPGNGKTELSRVSHLVLGAEISESGEMSGVFEFIPGTKNGDQAIAIAKAGLGVSSRGFGSVVPDGQGNHVVQENYKLVTWDIVADPANAGAHPNFVVESKERGNMDLEKIKKDDPELFAQLMAEAGKTVEADAREHAREALREEFEGQLQDESNKIKEEAVEMARSELLEDPEVAGAKSALDRIKEVVTPFLLDEDQDGEVGRLRKKLTESHSKIADQDEMIASLEEENQELVRIGKDFGFALHLERELGGNDRKDQVVEMVGNLAEYETLDALKTRIVEVSSVLAEEDEKQQQIRHEVAELKAQNAQLLEDRDKALAIGHKLGIKAYIERKVSGHPHRVPLRKSLDESSPASVGEVDRIVEEYTADHPVSKEFAEIDAWMGGDQRQGSPRNPLSLEEDNGGENNSDGVSTIAGVSMNELAQLAGV